MYNTKNGFVVMVVVLWSIGVATSIVPPLPRSCSDIPTSFNECKPIFESGQVPLRPPEGCCNALKQIALLNAVKGLKFTCQCVRQIRPISPPPPPPPPPRTLPPAPAPSPRITPNKAPTPSPIVSPGPSPLFTPNGAPSPSPMVSPGPSPGVSPRIAPGPSPHVSPRSAPGPSPRVSPRNAPGPSPRISPRVAPGPSPRVAPGPSPRVAPGPSPCVCPPGTAPSPSRRSLLQVIDDETFDDGKATTTVDLIGIKLALACRVPYAGYPYYPSTAPCPPI